MPEEIILNPQQFAKIKKILFDETGIFLEDSKQQMVQNRLIRRMRDLQLVNFDDYIISHLKGSSKAEIDVLVSQLTTNVTRFFREPYHYEYITETILPNCISNKQEEFTIWSAGCATGQEPYSMAMTIEEFKPSINYRVFASDISNKALTTAREGVYSMELLEGISPTMMKKYFMKGTGDKAGFAKIKKHILDKVEFAEINLIKNQIISKEFDVIFCRNVLIYFNVAEKELIVEYLARHLKADGYLCLGHSETINCEKLGLQMVYKTTYQKKRK